MLDLYAGSGALAIEALSRGASEATLVDSDVAAARAIRQNLDRLGIEEARVVRAGVTPFLKNAAQRKERWDLVFCDPLIDSRAASRGISNDCCPRSSPRKAG